MKERQLYVHEQTLALLLVLLADHVNVFIRRN